MPLFIVLKDNVPYMSTDYPECIYDKDTLKEMQDTGYYFLLNGKKSSIREIAQYVKTHLKSDIKSV